MAVGLHKKGPALAGLPVIDTKALVAFRDLIEDVPVLPQNAAGFYKRVAVAVNMMGLAAAAVILHNAEVLAALKVVNGCAFNIVAPIIKMF